MADLAGYSPADVTQALGPEMPVSALFTTRDLQAFLVGYAAMTHRTAGVSVEDIDDFPELVEVYETSRDELVRGLDELNQADEN